MKIIETYCGKITQKEAKIKEIFIFEDVKYCTAKTDSKLYPFRAYHFDSGQPIGDLAKTLKGLKELAINNLNKVKNSKNWEDYNKKLQNLETIN